MGMSCGMIETKPTKPAAPRAWPRTSKSATPADPIAAATMPMKKGQRRRRLTPKIAGSVMPKTAEAPPAPARPLSLASRVLAKTARAAAPWAMFAMEAIGKMKSPMPPLTGRSGISTAGKDWCRPVTTIGE